MILILTADYEEQYVFLILFMIIIYIIFLDMLWPWYEAKTAYVLVLFVLFLTKSWLIFQKLIYDELAISQKVYSSKHKA